MLESGNISGIRLDLLLSSHKISVDDARNASTERGAFADMV